MFPMRRPPFDPNLGQPHKLPPTPTLRQLQMQAAHRGRGPGGWQTGGSVGPRPKLLPADAPWPLPPGLNYDFVGARRQQGAESIAERMANQARRRASRSPGGWQGGGMVGRNMFNPRAAAAAAMRRNAPPPQERIRFEGPDWPRPRGGDRPPGGWNIGGAVDVDPREALMAEREMLQQQLQMADEVTAQEIMAQIMEINKELEMEARNFGMAGGGVASLMGNVRGYQGGGAPRRTGALHGSITGDPSSGRWTEHFPIGSFYPDIPSLSSIYSGWGTVDKRTPGQTITSFKPNLPFPNRPPGGG